MLVLFSEEINEKYIEGLREDLARDSLEFKFQSRPSGPFAALEWFIPTAIVFFITKDYFSGFFKKMGQSHYSALAEAIKNYRISTKSREVSLVGSAGKVNSNFQYSLAFSIEAIVADNLRFKLLLPLGRDPVTTAKDTDLFLEFLQRYFSGTLSPLETTQLEEATPAFRTICVTIDKNGRVIFVDPLKR